MFQSTDSRNHFSMKLSEVLDDIGMNDRMRMKVRKANMLMETMETLTWKSFGFNLFWYLMGSQIEGTTTIGLISDFDVLRILNSVNVIQDLSEWERSKENYLIIQDEDTTPGYCFLQLIQDDRLLSATPIPKKHYITDRKGRILLKNTIYYDSLQKAYTTQHGPSLAQLGMNGFSDSDSVTAFPCKSWPKSALCWLERQGEGSWPTQKIRRHAASYPCCVVPTGSKISKYPELEWRISTSLTERCLMFDLNITQIRCYVLMKMALKSFLNPQGEINISSFMCKTILLHCIENKESSTCIWKENNLLECLKECLMKLHNCVQNDNLSHFIIPENNLLAGQFTAETKHQLLKNISNFIQNDVQSLLRIDIDNLGKRLQVKLNLVPQDEYIFTSSLARCGRLSADFHLSLSLGKSFEHLRYLKEFRNKDIGIMRQTIERIKTYYNNDNELEHATFKFLAPFLCTTYGSVLASASIGLNHQVSPQALVWLLDGLDSDISSGRLKLASVFYNTGDMEKTELILRHTKSQYGSYPVVPICRCYLETEIPPPTVTEEFWRVCHEHDDVNDVKNITAFCVRFLRQEINCVPHELKYEMFRSTQHDMINRDEADDRWMDLAVVDSLPFLYFLQYKVYGHLHRYKDRQQAINKLANIIKTEKDLGHKETALNVLGQCMEQGNRPKQALKCFLLSLRQRARNNVARIHICRLLFSLLVGKKTYDKNTGECTYNEIYLYLR